MMNQLPIDVQLIVYKYLHTSAMTNTFHDMMNQLRSHIPYLRTGMIYDRFKQGNIYLIYDKNGLSDWSYPFWYAEYSDYLKIIKEMKGK